MPLFTDNTDILCILVFSSLVVKNGIIERFPIRQFARRVIHTARRLAAPACHKPDAPNTTPNTPPMGGVVNEKCKDGKIDWTVTAITSQLVSF